MKNMIQVKQQGEWVDYMPAIGIKPYLAAEAIGRTLRTPARVKPSDEDYPKIS